MKLSTKEKTAGTKLSENALKTFKGVDGKQHTAKWLAEQCIKADSARVSISENLFILAKGMTHDEFKQFDTDVRVAMFWTKAPAKADAKTKALHKPAPSSWKNACSIINQSYTHGIDLKHYDGVYAEKGLNNELKARKDALGVNNTASKGKVTMETLNPISTGLIMEITALDEAIKAQPDSATLFTMLEEIVRTALNDVQEMLKEGTVTAAGETVDSTDELLKQEFRKQAQSKKEGSKQATQ